MACLVGRDLRTVTGRNLRLLQTESGLDPWVQTPATIKKVLREKEDSLGIPPGDEWRVPYLTAGTEADSPLWCNGERSGETFRVDRFAVCASTDDLGLICPPLSYLRWSFTNIIFFVN